MKLSTLLIMFNLCQIAANSYAQDEKLALSIDKVGIKEVLSLIENQSSYKFLYRDNDLKKIVVSYKSSNASIDQVLNAVLSNTGSTYKILNKNLIVILPGESAQVTKVTGRVTDATTGEPLIGVNIVVEGTTLGTVSDTNGNYSLNISSQNSSLIFSYVGYISETVPISGRSVMDMKLMPDLTKLDEVVVIGYGTVKKKDLTGSVSQVQGKDLKNLPVRSAVEALQGKTSGVMITSTSGSPGSPAAIRIRGVGTINDNDPLYVVDGLPQSDINWLNTNDIESIDVLKDASASAIYGARAANGVIMITTKKGSGTDTKMNVTLDAYYGWQNPKKEPHMMNASQFIDYKNLARTNAGMAPFYTDEQKNQILQFLKENTGSSDGTNWWNEIKHPNAPVQNYNISVSGGQPKLTYFSSVGYMQQDGIINGSNYDRISWRTSVDSKLAKWFKLSTNLGIIYETRQNVYEDDTWDYGTIFSAMAADPITPVYRNHLKNIPDFLESSFFMNYIDPTNPFSLYSPVLLTNKYNPVAQIDIMKQSIWKGISIKGGVAADIDFTPWLKFKSSLGLDLGRGLSSGFTPKYYLDGDQYNLDATVSRYVGWSNYMVLENTLTFDKSFGKHHLLAMGGISTEKTDYESIGASKQGLVNNDKEQRIIDAATINPGASGSMSDGSMASYFGRLFYSFEDKYMLTANIRKDASSNFSRGHKWGVFPSFSVGWNFSKESLLRDVNWFTNGKFRFSWGQIGNHKTEGSYLSTYSGNNGWYLFGNQYSEQLTGGISYMGNVDLSWETTEQTDLGIDLEFFKKSLTFSADYFNKKTSNMLLVVPLPDFLGLPNNPATNAGGVRNNGWEFDLKYHGAVGEFTYTLGGNLFTFRNKVLSLGGGEPIYGGDYINYTTTKTEEGMPIGYFYGYKTNGIFQSQAEVDAYKNSKGDPIQSGARPGDLRYVDINGTDADGKVVAGANGVVDAADRTKIGNPFPDFTYGFNFSAAYKGFDIYLLFQGSQGNDIMNIKKIDFQSGVGWYNAPNDLMSNAWTEQNHSTSQFRISTETGKNLEVSDWLVEDGSYCRLKNIQLGYTIPQTLMKSMKIQNLRVWVGGYNLFTITKYSGLDPEIGNTNPRYTGIDYGYYPQAKSIMIGFNATF